MIKGLLRSNLCLQNTNNGAALALLGKRESVHIKDDITRSGHQETRENEREREGEQLRG